MIRMIKGTYGLVKNGTVEPMTKHSPAFSINATREAELVEAGVAVYEAEPENTPSESQRPEHDGAQRSCSSVWRRREHSPQQKGSDRPDRSSQGKSRQLRRNRGGTFRGVSS